MVQPSHMPPRDLTEGSVPRLLFRMAAPGFVGLIAGMTLAVVDTLFVARLGTDALTAISFTFPVTMGGMGLAMGFGAATMARVAQALGRGEAERARHIARDALLLAAAFGVLFVVVLLPMLRPLFRLLGAPEALLEPIVAYMVPWAFSIPVGIMPAALNSTMRANGNTSVPAASMVFAAVINGLLDWVLIFGMGPVAPMGIAGAAWASVTARTLQFLVVAAYVQRNHYLSFTVPTWAEFRAHIRELLQIAIPAAGTQMLPPLSQGIITGILARTGMAAVAAYGVAGRVELFCMLVMYSLAIGLNPISAQNWGAGKVDRIRRGLGWAMGTVFVWGGLVYVLLWFTTDAVTGLFTTEPDVLATASIYFAVVGLSYGAQWVQHLAGSTLNALGKATHSLAINGVRLWGLGIPLLWLGAATFGSTGAFVGLTVANALACVLSLWVITRVLRDVPVSLTSTAR